MDRCSSSAMVASPTGSGSTDSQGCAGLRAGPLRARSAAAGLTPRWVSACLLASALLVGACGSDEGAADAGDTVRDTAPTDTLGDTASTDTTADTGPVAPLCREDVDCGGSGLVCDCHGACVAAGTVACTEDRNCGVPRWCNTCTGFCEEQVALCTGCEEARACLDGGACLPYASGGSFCGLACVTDAGCPKGYGCQAIGGVAEKQCVARSGSCESLGLCSKDSECPIGQVCNEGSRTCAPGCTEDGQCQNGQVCVQARCVPPCANDDACTAPATCQGGKCKVPGACEKASDCPTPETYCSRESGTCVAGCQEDLNCQDAAKKCEGGVCVAKGCEHNFECAFGKVCEKSTGACVPYPSSEPHCATCDAQAETNPGCADPNLCATFQDADGNAKGDFCLVPCKDDPVDRCPQGWGCQKVTDENGGERFFCARPCYIAPVGTP